MTKTEIKKLVKTCVETLAKVKDIDLSIYDIVEKNDWGQLILLIFDIKLETNFGAVYRTELCLDNTILKSLLTEDYEGKAELGKSIISKIWHDIRDYVNDDPIDSQMRRMGMNKINIPELERNGPIYIDPNTAYARTDIDTTLEGYRRQQILKQRKDGLSISDINKY